MVVIVLDRVPASVRGELTRWLLQVRAGVFVGDVSAMVRDRLWSQVTRGVGGGSALLVHSADTEQGFKMHSVGDRTYRVADFDGLQLVRRV